MLRRSALLAGLAILVVPSPAAAAKGPLLSLTPESVGGAHRQALTGAAWRVRVVMQPWVEGQTAMVRFYRHGHRLAAATVPLGPSPTGRSGMVVVPFSTKTAGAVEVRATHRATPALRTLKARPVRVSVVAPRAAPGARGPIVRLLQRQLAALGYVVGRPGFYDARTARAVTAFRKVTGMARTAVASADVFRALARGAGHFRVRLPAHGKHVEADLSRQVLALIDNGKVQRIYPMSSGKPSTPTVVGSFRVYIKSPGTNAKGMYFSDYFVGDYAIHGYADVPVFAASHGCVRVPIPDAVPIYRWLHMGDIVDVYP
jgi:lipoprotein-anchoring transpeptidase ErfK/SrfK